MFSYQKRDVALAHASRTDEKDVPAEADKVAGRQVDDARLRYLRIEGELEVLERLVVLELGTTQPELELLGFTTLDLVGEQPEQELGIGQIVVQFRRAAQMATISAVRSSKKRPSRVRYIYSQGLSSLHTSSRDCRLRCQNVKIRAASLIWSSSSCS